MAILILTGPPGVGKNAIAAAYAQQQARCAVIDVDLVRWMILQPHKAPWEGEEGRRQRHLGVRNACGLARSFREHGFPAVIHDMLSAETARRYREELRMHGPQIIVLLPTFEEIVRRNRLRPPRLTAEQIRALYRSQELFADYDNRIDNTTLAPDEVAARLARM